MKTGSNLEITSSKSKPDRDLDEHYTEERYIIVPENVINLARQMSLAGDIFPTKAGFFKFARNHNIERRAGVPEHIAICCIAGSGHCTLDGKTWELNSGQVFFIEANTPHVYTANARTPWTILWFHYVGDQAKQYHDILGVGTSNPVVNISDIGVIITGFEDVFQYLQYGYTRRSIYSLSSGLSRWMTLCNFYKTAQYAPRRRTEQKIRQSVEYMKNNIGRPIRLDDLASIAGLSATYYSHAFKQKMENSPTVFLRELRLQEACSALKLSRDPISIIAMSVGYADPLYFSKVFRQKYSISPSQYREKYQL